MIQYKDFVPRQVTSTRKGLFGGSTTTEFETVDDAVAAANAWLASAGVKLLNVETVVLPNVWEEHEGGTADGSLFASGSGATWHQVVRCWYVTP